MPNYKQVPFSCVVDEVLMEMEPAMKQYVHTMTQQTEDHKANPKTISFHSLDLFPKVRSVVFVIISETGRDVEDVKMLKVQNYLF